MYNKNLITDICGWLLVNSFKSAMHLFAGHEQLVPPKDCSYTSICWVFALHKGFTEAVHKELQLDSAVHKVAYTSLLATLCDISLSDMICFIAIFILSLCYNENKKKIKIEFRL